MTTNPKFDSDGGWSTTSDMKMSDLNETAVSIAAELLSVSTDSVRTWVQSAMSGDVHQGGTLSAIAWLAYRAAERGLSELWKQTGPVVLCDKTERPLWWSDRAHANDDSEYGMIETTSRGGGDHSFVRGQRLK